MSAPHAGAALRITDVREPGAEWDAFVQRTAGGTAFHRSAWHRAFSRVLRHDTLYLEARDPSRGNQLVGVLPLVKVRSRLFGHYLVSLPFVNHGGPIGTSDAVQQLVSEAVRQATESGVDLLELRSRAALPLDLTVSHRKVAVLLDLPEHPDLLMKAFPSKLRSQVRRPLKDGVVVHFGPDHVGDFHRVFAEHMRDLGTPTHGRALFEELAHAFGEDAWVGVAYLNGVPIACGMGFRWGEEFEITWASSLRAYNRVSPNMGLYWAFMERAIERGCRIFNFGRATPGAPTHKFKLQWGGRDEPLHWYQLARDGRTGTPSPDSGALSLGPRIWRRLPLAVANGLGPRVVRLIP
jgi:FemAB-related protein (PEP-CTERM system-associated)